MVLAQKHRLQKRRKRNPSQILSPRGSVEADLLLDRTKKVQRIPSPRICLQRRKTRSGRSLVSLQRSERGSDRTPQKHCRRRSSGSDPAHQTHPGKRTADRSQTTGSATEEDQDLDLGKRNQRNDRDRPPEDEVP